MADPEIAGGSIIPPSLPSPFVLLSLVPFSRSLPSTSLGPLHTPTASTTPALKRFKFLSEKLQQSGSADNQSHTSSASTIVLRCKPRLTSTCMNLWQLGQKKMPSVYLLEQTAGSHPLLGPLAQDLHPRPTWSVCSPCVDGLQLAAEKDCLKIWRCVCF